MKLFMRNKSSGFTLIEIIVVIVLLGVLASAVSSFIKFGTQIYSETTTRDQLVSSARFAIERLNREVRNALPNSVIVLPGNCLKFTPILESTIYTDIPVAPEAATNPSIIKVIDFDETFDSGWNAVVYPLSTDDVYGSNDKVYGVSTATIGNERTIILDNSNVLFAEDSPTQRVYFVNGTVEYCLVGTELRRDGILMAQDIFSGSFEVKEATLQRNGMVQIHFQFEKNNEKVTFNNEIQVLNVP